LRGSPPPTPPPSSRRLGGVEQVYLGTAEALRRARERQEPTLTRRRAAGPLVLWQQAERLWGCGRR
jgi:hypothetical protein